LVVCWWCAGGVLVRDDHRAENLNPHCGCFSTKSRDRESNLPPASVVIIIYSWVILTIGTGTVRTVVGGD
jgi:hypothetical protein